MAEIDSQTGTFIAVYPDPGEALMIAREGGIPQEDLHVTLCVFPSGIDVQLASGILTDLADQYAEMTGEIAAVGTFSENQRAALASVQGLNELRADLVRALDMVQADYSRDYGFIPYVALGDGVSLAGVMGQSISFSAVSLVRGRERHDFPFAGVTVSPEQPVEEDAAEEGEVPLSAQPTLTAAVAPLSPPAEWFSLPEAPGPTPLTFTDDGQVYGHLATWGTCHTGFLNGALAECVQPPRSSTGYGHFHLAPLRTADGGDVMVGKLTFDTSHAPLSAGMQAASAHYDQTGSVGAFVRARDGQHGIWVSGALRSDLTPEGLRDLRANPPSGDWRSFNGSLELIASLAVPVPGFPIMRPQLALAASGSGDVEALILPGYTEDIPVVQARNGKGYLRRRAVLAAALNAERRNSLPDSAFAMPGRRYPIDTRARAVNALARSSGKSEEQQVKRAVCRKYGDLPSCK